MFTSTFFFFLGLFMALFGSSAEEVTGHRMRERGSDTQRPKPGVEPGLLQWGRSLCAWDARSTQ